MGKPRPILGMMFVGLIVVGVLAYQGYRFYYEYVEKNRILKQIIERLTADSRIAQVLVTEVQNDPVTQKDLTTIKFLEYDAQGKPLTPHYFTFAGDIIQFQSLVVRFDDLHVKQADALRGKSVYLFWKVFVLDGANTQEYEIAKVHSIPEGYKIEGEHSTFEEDLWRNFWDYALHSGKSLKKGVKNAQIEAPGTKFIPGMLYTLKIEHDGGIRIDAERIPEILKGEKIE